MQYELTEDQKLIRDTAREFAEKHVREGVLERDEKCAFPHHLVEQLAELGFMGMVYPEEYGGSEVDYVSFLASLKNWQGGIFLQQRWPHILHFVPVTSMNLVLTS